VKQYTHQPIMTIFVQPRLGFRAPRERRNYGSVQQSGKERLFSMPSPSFPLFSLNKILQHLYGTVYHLVCLLMGDCLFLLSLWSNINMIQKHAYRILISLSVSNVSGVPKYCWSDLTPQRESRGKVKLEVYSCRRFSVCTLV
jgi:hypothetical protein